MGGWLGQRGTSGEASTKKAAAERTGTITTGLVSTSDGHKIALFRSGHKHAARPSVSSPEQKPLSARVVRTQVAPAGGMALERPSGVPKFGPLMHGFGKRMRLRQWGTKTGACGSKKPRETTGAGQGWMEFICD